MTENDLSFWETKLEELLKEQDDLKKAEKMESMPTVNDVQYNEDVAPYLSIGKTDRHIKREKRLADLKMEIEEAEETIRTLKAGEQP
jgi:hypothetical protein